ncbi:MAG: hypothetical protein ILA34_04450 [Bacteroidaceae bacterium]|nr:hypothetical protein [Bacteroidaceae bacterium]
MESLFPTTGRIPIFKKPKHDIHFSQTPIHTGTETAVFIGIGEISFSYALFAEPLRLGQDFSGRIGPSFAPYSSDITRKRL